MFKFFLFCSPNRRRGGNGDVPVLAMAEDDDERLSELATHRAEKNEVDGAVDQRQDVEQIAEVEVDSVRELAADAAEDHGDTLRQFGDEEENDDRQQDPRRPVGFTLALEEPQH